MVSAHYALRMDYVDLDRTPLSTWLSANATGFLCVYETADGENPHIHAVFHSGLKLSGLRSSFKKAFVDKVGNGAYSLKVCDDDVEAYMRYMCKGASVEEEPTVIVQQGLDYTPEKVKAAWEMYWVNNAAIKANKRKRVKCSTIVEELELACKAKGVKKSDREGIALEYIRMYKDARKGINVFHARSVVNTVAILLDDTGDVAKVLAGQIAFQ